MGIHVPFLSLSSSLSSSLERENSFRAISISATYRERNTLVERYQTTSRVETAIVRSLRPLSSSIIHRITLSWKSAESRNREILIGAFSSREMNSTERLRKKEKKGGKARLR